MSQRGGRDQPPHERSGLPGQRLCHKRQPRSAVVGDGGRQIAFGGDRAGTVRTARSMRDRDSVLGRYSLDDDGLTTSAAYAALEVRDGEIAWGRA